MGFERRRYIRTVEITKRFYQVIDTTDQPAYIDRNMAKAATIGTWIAFEGKPAVLENWRKLTPIEDAFLKTIKPQDEEGEPWKMPPLDEPAHTTLEPNMVDFEDPGTPPKLKSKQELDDDIPF